MSETSNGQPDAAGIRPTLVIVEGGLRVAAQAAECLRANGYETLLAEDVRELSKKLRMGPADAVVFAAELLQASADYALLKYPEDIAVLARHFCGRMAKFVGKEVRISNKAIEALQTHLCPCDIRQLKSIVERAVLFSGASEIGPERLYLPTSIEKRRDSKQRNSNRKTAGEGSALNNLEAAEREHIGRILRSCGGNRTRAAMALGIARSTLIRKIQELGIEE